MKPVPIIPADAQGLSKAAAVLRAGGVVVYPTETLYALGCLPHDEAALQRVLAVKGRPPEKTLPLIAADEEMAAELVWMVGPAEDLARLFWPGPLTLILKAKRAFSPVVASGGKVAVRVSSHPAAQALSRRLNSPLVSTSANLTGRPGVTLAAEVQRALAAEPPDLILEDDPCPGGPGSTIIDLTESPPRVIRAGAIAESELKGFITGWA